ncbi:cytochrome P450 [Candidatus Poriferisodalis sp.]|uniref:cytochrome P450 n=1 Tax=Candidatus Poriferisodalis sp. TaxID=3101277 RepID=UPI003B0216E7
MSARDLTGAHSSREFPSIRLADLARLAVRLAAGAARTRRSHDAGAAMRAWYQASVQRTGSENLMLRLGVKRLLVVTGREMSHHVSAQTPCAHGYGAGPTKVRAMSFLAPKALTVADGERWQRLREFNESVLAAASTTPHAEDPAALSRDAGDSAAQEQFLVGAVRDAFGGPVSDIADVRRCMRETMRTVVFGPSGIETRLLDDLEVLMRHVRSPVRRVLLGWCQRGRRRRFYAALRKRWGAGPAAGSPGLIDRAMVAAASEKFGAYGEDDLLQQVPHWMFTFTGSGTDLLVRTLGVLGARDDAYERVRAEMIEHDVTTDAAAVAKMEYLTACLLEVCRLYPPVTRTFMSVGRDDEVEGCRVPAGSELLHCFTEHHRDTTADPTADDFCPERWLGAGSAAGTTGAGHGAAAVANVYSSLFLGGARTCPGQDLILLVCKAAISTLINRGRIRVSGAQARDLVRSAALARDPMPRSFPAAGLRYEFDADAQDGGS